MSKKINYHSLTELDGKIAELQCVYNRVEILKFGIGFCLVWIVV